MIQKTFFIIFKGPLLKQIRQFFLESKGHILTLSWRRPLSSWSPCYHIENSPLICRANHIEVKSICIRSFSGPYFLAFGLNAGRYSVSLRIQSKCGKMRTTKAANTDTSYSVPSFLTSWVDRLLMKQHLYKVYYTGNQVYLYFWGIKLTLKHCIVSLYYFHDCTYLIISCEEMLQNVSWKFLLN